MRSKTIQWLRFLFFVCIAILVMVAVSRCLAQTNLPVAPPAPPAIVPQQLPSQFQVWIATLVFHWPKVAAILLFIGGLRPFFHSVNAYLESYCQKNLTKTQLSNLLYVSGSKNFKRIEFIVQLIFSIKPSALIGAMQISQEPVGDPIKLPPGVFKPSTEPAPEPKA